MACWGTDGDAARGRESGPSGSHVGPLARGLGRRGLQSSGARIGWEVVADADKRTVGRERHHRSRSSGS